MTMLPKNGQVGMSKSMVEQMFNEDLDDRIDEVVLTFEDGELVNQEAKSFE